MGFFFNTPLYEAAGTHYFYNRISTVGHPYHVSKIKQEMPFFKDTKTRKRVKHRGARIAVS